MIARREDVRILGCQMDIAWEDKAASHERARRLLETAEIVPGSLVVLPEMFATGFSMNVEKIAESTDGPTHVFLRQLAASLRAFVVAGVVTRAEKGGGRNEALVLGPDGRELARYCKLHPFSYGGENRHYEKGSDVAICDWGPLKIAPFVCYDLRFPEVFRRAVRRGAQLFVVIANWPAPRDAHWRALLAARAIENQAYVVGVNRLGADPRLRYLGHGMIIDPRGNVLAQGGEEEEVFSADVAVEPLVEYRGQFPVLDDIRGEFLG